MSDDKIHISLSKLRTNTLRGDTQNQTNTNQSAIILTYSQQSLPSQQQMVVFFSGYFARQYVSPVSFSTYTRLDTNWVRFADNK